MSNRKNIFLWALYDFANSIVMIAFLFYFSQWLVIDMGWSDAWYNATLVIGSIAFLIVGPVLGSICDKTGDRMKGLRVSTIITIVLFLATSISALLSSPLAAVIFYSLALAAYLISFVFYTPLMNDLVTSKDYGNISGWGQGANVAGQIAGLLLMIPIVTGKFAFLGLAGGRVQAFIPATFSSIRPTPQCLPSPTSTVKVGFPEKLFTPANLLKRCVTMPWRTAKGF